MSADGQPTRGIDVFLGPELTIAEAIAEVRRDGTVDSLIVFLHDGTSHRVDWVTHLRDMLPPPVLEQTLVTVRDVLASGGVDRSQYELNLHGNRRWMVARTVALTPDLALRIVTDATRQRNNEDALRASERRFRLVVEQAADAVFVIDDRRRIVMVNKAACSSLGYSEEQLLEADLELILPDPAALSRFSQFRESGEDGPIYIDATHERADGVHYRMEVCLRRVEIEGRPHYLAFARDVTERTRVQDALRRSEATMRSLVEHAPAVIALSDLDGRLRFVSGELAGFQPRQLVGKRLSRVLAPGHAEELDAAIDRIRASGYPEDLEVRLYDATQTESWHNMRIAKVGSGDPPHALIHIVQDVTEARRTREALRASEARFRQLVEQAVDGIYVFDDQGRMVDVNERACEMLGWDRSELLGRSIIDLGPELDLDDVLEHCRQLPPRASVTFETTHVCREGRSLPVELRIGRMAGGGPPRFLALARDITDRLNLERAALDAVEGEQRRFGRDLHDGLGQHLAGIAFLAKALEQRLRGRDDPDAASAAEISKRVNEAIAQTRALAHGLAPVGVHGNELVAALQALASDTEQVFRVRCRVTANVDIVDIDDGTATGLYRIAQEAVTNALRHAGPSTIVIRLTVTQTTASLRIQDDGHGIGDIAQRAGGLGMQIMTLRARRMGGRLEVRPRFQGGTTVLCLLSGDNARGAGGRDPL